MDIERYGKKGLFESKSGLILSTYYDCIKLFFDKKMFPTQFIESFTNAVNVVKKPINLIGIETMGRDLVIFLIGFYSGMTKQWRDYINHLFFMKERKNRDRLYGKIEIGWDTFIIDDIITTGSTISSVLDYLDNNEIKVNGIICLKNNSDKLDINNIPIYDLSEY